MAALATDVLPSLRAEVVEAGERFSAGQHKLVVLVAALDESGEWAFDGAATCAHWIASALDIEVCTAREWLRIGHALTQLPMTDEAFASGHLSYSKYRETRAGRSARQGACSLAGQP